MSFKKAILKLIIDILFKHTYTEIEFISFFLIFVNPSGLVVRASHYLALGPEFDSRIGNVYTAFYHFEVNKNSTKLA